MERNFKSVWLLAAISATAMSSVPMMMLIGMHLHQGHSYVSWQALLLLCTLPMGMLLALLLWQPGVRAGINHPSQTNNLC